MLSSSASNPEHGSLKFILGISVLNPLPSLVWGVVLLSCGFSSGLPNASWLHKPLILIAKQVISALHGGNCQREIRVVVSVLNYNHKCCLFSQLSFFIQGFGKRGSRIGWCYLTKPKPFQRRAHEVCRHKHPKGSFSWVNSATQKRKEGIIAGTSRRSANWQNKEEPWSKTRKLINW